MKLEVEQKYRIDDATHLRAALERLGAKFGEPRRQVDSYFNHPSRDFAQTDEAFRIRTIGEENFVTYKGPKHDHAVKTRRELEQPLVGGDEARKQFAELLELLSFRPTAEVAKRRSSATIDWRGTHYEIAWDEVDGLGTFLELELVVDEADRTAAQEKIAALESELGLQNVERRSYLQMVLEKR